MVNKTHVIAAITFIVVFGIGACVFFFWLSPVHEGSRSYQVETDFSVGGLTAQSPVKFKGLKVGHVQSVGFDPGNPNKVHIVFVVGTHVPMTQSSYAQLGTQGITGLKTLNLFNPNPKAKPLNSSSKNPQRIPLRRGLISQLEDSGKQDMHRVNDILKSVHALLNQKNRQHLSQMLAQIDAATRQLTIAEKAAEPALQQLPALTRQMQETLAKIKRLTATAQAPVDKAGGVEDSVQSLSESSQTLIRRLNEQTLPQLDQLTQTMNQAAHQVDQLTRELKAKPQSILTGPPKVQPGPGEPGFGQ